MTIKNKIHLLGREIVSLLSTLLFQLKVIIETFIYFELILNIYFLV